MERLPPSRHQVCPPEPFRNSGQPHPEAPAPSRPRPPARPAPPPSFPAQTRASGRGVPPQEVLAFPRGRYFRLRYHGRLLPGVRREEAAVREPVAERSGAGLPPQCLVTALPLVRPAARLCPSPWGAPPSPWPPAAGPAAFQALCSQGRGVPKPAAHPVRSGDARPLSGLFDFPRDSVEWSAEQAAAAERKVQENSTQRVCQEKQGALQGLSVDRSHRPATCWTRARSGGQSPEVAKSLLFSWARGRTGDVQRWRWVTPVKPC